jgi:hypothetical protein
MGLGERGRHWQECFSADIRQFVDQTLTEQTKQSLDE